VRAEVLFEAWLQGPIMIDWFRPFANREPWNAGQNGARLCRGGNLTRDIPAPRVSLQIAVRQSCFRSPAKLPFVGAHFLNPWTQEHCSSRINLSFCVSCGKSSPRSNRYEPNAHILSPTSSRQAFSLFVVFVGITLDFFCVDIEKDYVECLSSHSVCRIVV